jgi:hypothetical protein
MLSRIEKALPEIPPALPFSKGGELFDDPVEDATLAPFRKTDLYP